MSILIDYLSEEYAVHTVNMLWPNEDLLIKRIYWKYGQPILLLGLTATAPHQVFHQLVHKYTEIWKELETILITYEPHLDETINCIHTFGELLEYVGDFCVASDDEHL